MILLSKVRLFSLFALFGILTLMATWSAQAGSSFPPNPNNYWNMGELTLPSNGNGNIEHCTLESSNLKTPNNVVGFNVYTPPGYNSSNQNYPVIYLLHGVNGNEYNYFNGFNSSSFFNSSSGSLPGHIDSGITSEAIIVFVNGGAGSFYDDWNDSTDNGPSSSFPIMSESVIMEDVIPFVDANFRTIASRNGRAIEGFSMGARGAIKLAFTYPDQFCSTIAYAGAAYELIPASAGSDHPRFGVMEEEYQIDTILANNVASIKANGLQIRMADSPNDGAAGQGTGNDDLSVWLDGHGIAYEFEPNLAGVSSHNWAQYHQATGLYGLNFHFQCFDAATPAPIILGSADMFTYIPLIEKPGEVIVSPGSCN